MNRKQRTIIFIDGNNFYHGVKSLGLLSGGLHYEKFSEKLAIDGQWLETRYYIGKVRQEGDLTRYANQRKFLHFLEKFNRVRYFLGRVESRPAERTARQLSRWLNSLPERCGIKISGDAIAELRAIADKRSVQYVEKAVDVMIATDMISMAYEDKYDVAYLLSADGDYTPAVKKVRGIGKKVFVASAIDGHALRQVADDFIRLRKESFHGCWE